MQQEIKQILQRWQRSLALKGMLDEWSLNQDFCKIDNFLRLSKIYHIRKLVANCRNLAIKTPIEEAQLKSVLDKTISEIKCFLNEKYNVDDNRPTIGQRKRYQHISKTLGSERVRCCKGKRLRNLDVTLMDKRSSRVVRRIVEKRMCQEYHRQHKSSFRSTGNRSRQNMRRAVSFQLYNLGQLEGSDISRDFGTHWKWRYDTTLQEWVLRKKVGYETLDDALKAKKGYEESHNDEMQVYQCDHCKKYHIGHPRENHLEYIA